MESNVTILSSQNEIVNLNFTTFSNCFQKTFRHGFYSPETLKKWRKLTDYFLRLCASTTAIHTMLTISSTLAPSWMR